MTDQLIGQNCRSAFLTPTRTLRRLAILLTAYHHPTISQHKIARATALSSAMVNSYIKELVTEGLIALSSRNNRDLNYTLTEAGKQALAELLADYSAEIVQLYTQAKNEIGARLEAILPSDQPIRLLLFGASETCELVLRSLERFPQAEVVGLADSDPGKQGSRFHGYPVVGPEEIEKLVPEVVIITSFAKQDEIYQSIRSLENHGIGIRKLAAI